MGGVGGGGLSGGGPGIIGGGGDGFAGGGVKSEWRSPQSMQSCPYGHRLNSEPGPPSSQSPSLVCAQSLMHKLG